MFKVDVFFWEEQKKFNLTYSNLRQQRPFFRVYKANTRSVLDQYPRTLPAANIGDQELLIATSHLCQQQVILPNPTSSSHRNTLAQSVGNHRSILTHSLSPITLTNNWGPQLTTAASVNPKSVNTRPWRVVSLWSLELYILLVWIEYSANSNFMMLSTSVLMSHGHDNFCRLSYPWPE